MKLHKFNKYRMKKYNNSSNNKTKLMNKRQVSNK